MVDIDLPCSGCGYNLRTSRHDGVCTECGLPVARSLGRDNELWAARPAWLRSLSCGVWMMIAAQGLFAASLVAAGTARWFERLFEDPRVVVAGLIALGVLQAAGAWLLTRRERLFVRPPRAESIVRLTARVGMCGPLLGIGALLWFEYARGVNAQTVTLVVVGLMGLLVPGVLATYWHLRGLARRVLSRRMSEYATIVAVGGAATALVFLTIFMLGAFDVQIDVAEDVSFVGIVLVFTAAILFYLWSLLVLVLFAVAFAKASRGARALWNERAGA